MSDETIGLGNPAAATATDGVPLFVRPHPAAGYGVGVGLVIVATIIAFVVEHTVPSSNLALVFVLPVLVTALSFGWSSAIVATLAAVASFDFFFTEPRYSLRVNSPADLWAMALLLVVAAIASTVAAQSRRKALVAQLAANRAEALHRLAHLVVEGATTGAVCTAAGEALTRIFQAPALVLLERGGGLETAASTRGAVLSSADEDAARWTLANHARARGEVYPFDKSEFDFWPISFGGGQAIVLGVGLAHDREDRPANPTQYVEMVGGYLAMSLGKSPSAPRLV